MALKPIVNVKCPCCGKVLEVDVAKERVISHREGKHLRDDAREGEDAMDVALRQQRETTSLLDQRFAAAQESERSRKEKLEELFRKAQEKTREDPEGEVPKKVWD